jgi:hypothetical protein
VYPRTLAKGKSVGAGNKKRPHFWGHNFKRSRIGRRRSGKAMQVSVPPKGTELRELVTREKSEDHPWICGLFSTCEKSTCRAKTCGRHANSPSILKPFKWCCLARMKVPVPVAFSLVWEPAECITMHIDCMLMPQKNADSKVSRRQVQPFYVSIYLD